MKICEYSFETNRNTCTNIVNTYRKNICQFAYTYF